jgi:hypothetical protein
MWIGVPARADHVDGGLWRSADGGMSWARIQGFTGVSSLLATDAPTPAVWVSESHHYVWEGGILRPRGARLVRSDADGRNWVPSDSPPLGTRSEVELSGVAPDGELIVRVDETIYRSGQRPLWRILTEP